MPRKAGKWNAPLIARLRRLWREVQRKRGGEVQLRHVRSHILVPGNEIADWLAGCGTGRRHMTTESVRAWTQTWLDAQRSDDSATDGTAHDRGRPPGRPPG
jgi:ribonuclease HI